MKIGILSGTVEAGGAQRVCLKMIQALKEANHEVTLITLTKTDWSKVQKMLGEVIRPDREVVLLRRNFRGFDAYKPLLAALLLQNVRRKLKLDLVINSQADVLPIRADMQYVHYPTFSDFENAGINLKYSRSLFWRIYIAPYKFMHRFFANYLSTGLLVTNSSFSKRAIWKHVGRNSIVVFPPVEIEAFANAAKDAVKKDGVVSCGRYSPEKNYEYVLEVANRLRNVEFAVVGSFSGKKSTVYYEKLRQIVSSKGLENVELLHGVQFGDLLRHFGEAKVYMHAMKNEHFGITVVEAMAAGLIPVVFRAGGPWEDILKKKQGYFGFSYQDQDEASAIIKMLMANNDLRSEIVNRNAIYVNQFSGSVFEKQFISLVEKIA
jgi:glycosyltransferase involved in cell wall biosynthesis